MHRLTRLVHPLHGQPAMPHAAKQILAVDLGAESGRLIAGGWTGEQIKLDVVHRFPNRPVRVLDKLYWDVLDLHREILQGLRIAGGRLSDITSVGVDTWGVDFGLIGQNGTLLGHPRHYRDPHTENILAEVDRVHPLSSIYKATGIQLMRFNSLFQLAAMRRDGNPLLDQARHLLFMPDLFHYFLSGETANEMTNASTSQMLDPHTRQWRTDLTSALDLPHGMLGTLVPPGTALGTLRPSVAQETGLGAIAVVVPATHDTAAAVAAVPVDPSHAATGNWAYISSGTWSLLGLETKTPYLDERARAANATNEGGVDGTIRLLKNIMGLWIVQECRRAWEREGQALDYETLTHLAAQAPAGGPLVDPDHASFLLPEHMPSALQAYCSRTGQQVPEGPGPVLRCALESLAFKYRFVLEQLESLAGVRAEVIHVVGGGCQNRLLNQLTADACGRPVVAGPVEATAAGNILTQALGLGLVGSLSDARAVVRRSFELMTHEPSRSGLAAARYAFFQTLVGH